MTDWKDILIVYTSGYGSLVFVFSGPVLIALFTWRQMSNYVTLVSTIEKDMSNVLYEEASLQSLVFQDSNRVSS
jgi:hypothetical protein